MVKKRRLPMALDGDVWVTLGDEKLGGHGRMALLQAIAEEGSITRAAAAVGLSYKAAWDAIDAMNRLAESPLVERGQTGRGGGSQLTEHGRRLAERFSQIEGAHRRFVRLLAEQALDLSQEFQLTRILNMKTSARNQFVGTVSGYKAGAVNDEVELLLPGGTRIVATVTRDSTESLGLKAGASAFALVKASSVLLGIELDDVSLSARNRFDGTVVSVEPGAINAEVTLVVAGGVQIAAVVTMTSLKALGLKVGSKATAFFKASAVILGTLA